MSYHPNFFKPSKSKRSSCFDRLDLIKGHISKGSLLDIGCSGGFYSFGLNGRCSPIVAFDYVEDLIKECLVIQKKYNTGIDFRVASLTADFVKDSGPWENVLYMSIHHHIITQFGFDKAAEMFSDLSKHCLRMFFDMGQKNENCREHKWWQLLPEIKDQEKWLVDYILSNTEFVDIDVIGSSSVHGVNRFFFKLEKEKIGDYFVLKKLYRTEGSLNQRFTEDVISQTEKKRTFYIVQKDNKKYWIKEYTDPSLGHGIEYEYKETKKLCDPVCIDGHSIKAASVHALKGNRIVMDYYENHKPYAQLRNTLTDVEKSLLRKLIEKWLNDSGVKNYDLSNNNTLITFDSDDNMSVIMVDFERSLDANWPKWNKFLKGV